MNNETVALESVDAQIVLTTQGDMIAIQGTPGLSASDFILILRAAMEGIEAQVEAEDYSVSYH